jgi:hypothetical protein
MRQVPHFSKSIAKFGSTETPVWYSVGFVTSKRALMKRYNQRWCTEIEQFRTAKSRLHLSAHRKRQFVAQKALVLLADMAYNLLADFHRRALAQFSLCRLGSQAYHP